MRDHTRPKAKSHRPRKQSQALHRHTLSAPRVEIRINVYNLLPPGKIATCLWHVGTPLLHSGVAIEGKEYAYGAHAKPGVSGVYCTKPGLEPPGVTFKATVLHGFSFRTRDEIEAVVQQASVKFEGCAWNLIYNNCNHFTSYLCEQLTGRVAPSWLNRAARVGVALPCMIPAEWLAAPDAGTAEGQLLQNMESDENESTAMLSHAAVQDGLQYAQGSEDEVSSRNSIAIRDSSGRVVPAAERAHV